MFQMLMLAFSVASADMTGLVATSGRKFSLATFPEPALGDLRAKFKDLPESCEVLVAISDSSVNPADQSPSAPYPQVMGSDIAGTVTAVEDSCQRLKVGDKVWADIGAVTYLQAGGKGKENGGYARLAVALETQVGAMPANLDFAEAAALPKVALTSWKALTWYGGAPFTQDNGTVLVLGGSGGTGTTGIQLAKALGATRVITTTSAANSDYVTQQGADEVIDYHSENWYDVLDEESVDMIYDCVGEAFTGDRAMKILKSGGYYVTLRGATPSSVPDDKHATGFINSDTNLDNVELLDALRDLAEAGKLSMKSLKTYELTDILDAFAESADGHVVGKLVIKMPSEPMTTI